MSVFFALIGVTLVLGVWAVYVRLGELFEFWKKESEANLKSLKQELAILWVAISSEPEDRATRRKEFGLGPLYVFDGRHRVHADHRELHAAARSFCRQELNGRIILPATLERLSS
jgi:hypothetical protein